MKKGRKDTKVTLLIDCSAIGYAAYHTMGHLATPDDTPTGVIYGFLKRILSLAIKFKTTDFITCWDSGLTHRHLAYPPYKQKREESKNQLSDMEAAGLDSLKLQMITLNHITLPKLGFRNNFIQLMYEADDLLAYWVNKLKNKNRRVVMVTSDSDMYQCLDHCEIWNPMKKKFFTKKTLMEKFGVKPNQWAMAKAIGGCSGDNVIGIEGVADPKSSSSKALKYLRGELSGGKIKQRIESKGGQVAIKRNLPLVTVPYREDIMKKMIKRRNYFSRKRLIRVFDAYHFRSFLEKETLQKWEETFLGKE
ncbi:hypothetical protein DRH13_03130 [Candidatus Woesebacteria bacterium]|nr:MAG: hypothetical protein DRH13_03130 [Candidatus Woesebacteria bacterium]